MPGIKALAFGIVVLSVILSPTPASAHRPYTTRVEKVLLPSGEVGEIRLLHGDGILAANPIRAVVVGADGRLLGRSHQSTTMTLICSREDQCRAYDAGQLRVIEIDSATFREGGPQVPYHGEELWAIEHGNESWGFRTRDASLTERIEGEIALAMHLAPVLVFLVTMGILLALAVLMVWCRPSQAKISDGLFILKALAAVAMFLLASVMILVVSFVSGMTDVLFAGSIAAGVMVVLLLRYARRRLFVRVVGANAACGE